MPENRSRKSLRLKPNLESLENRKLLAADLQIDVSVDESLEQPALVAAAEIATVRYHLTNSGSEVLRDAKVVNTAARAGNEATPVMQVVDVIGAGQRGTLLTSFDGLKARRLLNHPERPMLLATLEGSNSVAVINTRTLLVEQNIRIGSRPAGMALSSDGNTLYVANSGSNYIGVIDLESMQTKPRIFVKSPPDDVEVAADGSLYVLTTDSLSRIDPASGRELWDGGAASGGELAINGAMDRLYYADYGLSPATLRQYDISGSTPVELWRTPVGSTSGANGRDLAISHDGAFVSFAAEEGQIGDSIALYSTPQMAIEGVFETGSAPTEVTFSPDDQVAYTVDESGDVKTWETEFFSPLGSFEIDDEARELLVDRTGQLLFAAFEDGIRVYSTGRGYFNVGDTNRNLDFDPGETWLYESSITPELNLTSGQIQAHAQGESAAATDSIDFQVVGLAKVEVTENLIGAKIADVPHWSVYVENPRFEMIERELKLVDGVHLDSPADDGLKLPLRSTETDEIIGGYLLTVTENDTPFQNRALPADVNLDGLMTPIDAFFIINELNSNGASELPRQASVAGNFVDSNADGFVTPVDALIVIKAINESNSAPSGEASVEVDAMFDLEWLEELRKKN